MKLTLAIFLLSTIGYSQEWSKEQIDVLDKYELVKTDHRGIHFSANENEKLSFSTLNEALEHFLTLKINTDLLTVYVQSFPTGLELKEKSIGIKAIVEAYIQINK